MPASNWEIISVESDGFRMGKNSIGLHVSLLGVHLSPPSWGRYAVNSYYG